jgi:hypothetical protein
MPPTGPTTAKDAPRDHRLPRRRTTGMRAHRTVLVAALAAAAAAALLAFALLPGGGRAGGVPPVPPQAPGEAGLTAIGAGKQRVHVSGHRTERSIRAGVAEAKRLALPDAIAAARVQAETLGAAAGVELGRLVSVREQPPSSYGAWEQPPSVAQYCWLQRSRGRRRASQPRRVCRAPADTVVVVTATYAMR